MNKCVRAMILDKNNQVVLLKHNGMQKFTFPGGKVDNGEYPDDAIIRELSEEVGLHVEYTDLIKVTSFNHKVETKEHEEIDVDMNFYEIRSDDLSSLINKEPESHESLTYIPLTVLLKYKDSDVLDEAVKKFISYRYEK